MSNMVIADGHEIYAMSRFEAITYRGNKPYILISVSDIDLPDINFPEDKNRKDVIRFAFGDNLSGEFFKSDAKRLWDFVNEYWASVEAIVFHCEMGWSRSPALAAAITKVKGGNEQEWFVKASPNLIVYNMMLGVHASIDKKPRCGCASLLFPLFEDLFEELEDEYLNNKLRDLNA